MSNALTKPQLAILQQAWADGLNGRDKLYRQIKRDHPEAKITWRQVAAFLKRTQPHQLFIYQRKPKPISVFRRSRPLQMLTVDLTALPVQTLPDKTQRKWILLAIDTFSRYAWASVLEPQPPSSGPTAKLGWEAFWPILKEVKEELNGDVTGLVIQSDGGNEFKDRFHDELTRRKIKHYYGVPGKPASQSMVERLNQTIKGKLKRLWRARGVLAQKPWGESTIQAVVASYNDQVHSALPKGVTPADVMDAIDEDATGLIEKVKQHQEKVWARKKGNYEQKWIDEGNQSKYKEGDIVRKISAQPDKYDTQW